MRLSCLLLSLIYLCCLDGTKTPEDLFRKYVRITRYYKDNVNAPGASAKAFKRRNFQVKTKFDQNDVITRQHINQFQKFYKEVPEIRQTGELDEATISLLTDRPCGNSDHIVERRILLKSSPEQRIERNRWRGSKIITWSLFYENCPSNVNGEQLLEITTAGFCIWAHYADIQFVYKPPYQKERVDIAIHFASRNSTTHDSYSSTTNGKLIDDGFDGPGGIECSILLWNCIILL